jgi:hypothetical protein
MRSSSSRIQIGWFSMKRECSKHTYGAYKIRISLKTKLIHFSLKIIRLRSRWCFKRYNIFMEAFNSIIKDIHLALEVKIFIGNSTPAMGLYTEFSTWKPGLPTKSHHRHHRKRGKEETCTQHLKPMRERLRSTRLTRHDQAIRLLHMQRLQALKTF